MKQKRSTTSYFPEVEVILKRAFTSEEVPFSKGMLSAYGRQRIWRSALTKAEQVGQPVRRFWRWAFYPGMIMLFLMAFLSGYGGVVFASGMSIPGEPLYLAERGAEMVWLTFTPTSKRCEVQLALLQRRMYETRALLDAGRDVPEDLFQEIMLLFESVAEEIFKDSDSDNEVVASLIVYRDTLAVLWAYHPGVRNLSTTLAVADRTVVKLGGMPLED